MAEIKQNANNEWVMTGNIEFDPIVSEPTGFVNRTDSAISFDDATRTFTIQPTISEYSYYIQSKKYTQTAPLSAAIDDIEGNWYFYFDGNTLTTSQTFNPNILYTKAYIAHVYWDATNKKAIILGEERHGLAMDWATHSYLHNLNGARYKTGFAISGYTIGLSGDSNLTIGISNGTVVDEDIENVVVNGLSGDYLAQPLTDPAQIPVLYREGSTTWRKDTATDFYFKNTASGRVNYNYLSGGSSWVQQEATNNYHVAYWIFATNNILEPIMVIQGQREDALLADAITNNNYADLVGSNLPVKEFKLLYLVIIQTNDTFGGSRKAIVQGVVDSRAVSPVGSTATVPTSNDHSSLINLDFVSAGHTGFQELDVTLTALAAFNSNGLLTQTAADTFVARTLSGGSNKISITNGNGVSSNPIIDIVESNININSFGGTPLSRASGGTGKTTYLSGSVIFADNTTLTEDNTNFFWDNSAKRLDLNDIRSTSLSANTVLIADSSKNIRSSTITSTELSYLSGATSNIQAQLNMDIPSYGELYAYTLSGSTIITTVANTYYPWATTNVGTQKGTGYVVGSALSGNLTIGASGAGIYSVDFSAAFSAPSRTQPTFAIHKNGTAQSNLTNYKFMSDATEFYALSGIVVTGDNVTGSFLDIQTANGTYWYINESPSPGIDVQVFWGDVNRLPGRLNFSGSLRNSNGSCNIKFYAWNFVTSEWDPFTNNVEDLLDSNTISLDENKEFSFSSLSGASSSYISNKEVKVRIFHSGTSYGNHDLYIDKLTLTPSSSDLNSVIGGFLSVSAGDIIDVRIKSDTANSMINIYNANLHIARIDSL